jgi:hypothetical protein
MSKLMQAVNELKGDLGNSFDFNQTLDSELYQYIEDGTYMCVIGEYESKRLSYICTVKEFNKLVAELSAAKWIK